MMQTIWQDVRYGLRMLAKSPGFSAVAILTLALGIGANTTIFSVVDAVLLRPLPFSEPSRLVAIGGIDTKNNEHDRALSYLDFVDLRKGNRTMESMAAYSSGDDTLTGAGEPLHLRSEVVSADLFNVLRANPLLGRTFTSSEDQPGTRVVILSHSLWQSRFGSNPNIAGQSITLDGKLYTVVGVMPADFQFPMNTAPNDLWTTMAVMMNPGADGDKPMTEERGAHFMEAIARLKPGVTPEQASNDAAAVGASLEKQYPDTNGHLTFGVKRQLDFMVGEIRPILFAVLGAVAFLLLIACANTANLLLARAAGRQREMAIRVSIGAGRARILRQLLTESVLLAVAGGAMGLLIAAWGTRLFAALSTVPIPRLRSAHVDLRVLGFTLGVSLFTAVLFGVAPALHAMRFNLFPSLKEGGRNATEGAGHARLRSLLVIAEVSLSLVLLIGASLLLESMLHLAHQSPGFEPRGVLTFNTNLPDARYGKPEQSALFYKNLLERIRTIPGVQNASGVLPLPLSEDVVRTTFQIEGHPVAPSDEPRTHFRCVGLDYFQTMHIPLVAGRDFSARDTRDATPVIIVNQALARKFFPNDNPIGKRTKPGVSDSGPEKMREIVGVVGDVKHRALWREADPESYVPYDQVAIGQMFVVVRTQGDPASLLPAVREQVKALDSEVPLYAVKTLEDYVAASMASRKFISVLCGVFAGAGLLLAVVGLFGVMSYTVSQRTHELGVRAALGAARVDILQLILRQGMTMTAVGIAVGVVGALAVTRVLSSQLFGIKATDPLTFVGVALVLAAVALAACYFPARRATRVDPMVALRYE
jgi:putative ABC transport system permease protein